MAEKLTDFMAALEASEPSDFTRPQVRYGYEEDSLLFYFRQDESFAHRVNNVVTLFLSFEGHDVVGCQINGLRRKMLSDGIFGIAIRRKGQLELGLFFHLLAYEISDADERKQLVEHGQRAKGLEVDTEQLALSSKTGTQPNVA
jgi:hypothetical protein